MIKINQNVNNINRIRSPYSTTNRVRLHASERDLPFSNKLWSYFINQLTDSDVRYYPNCDHAKLLLSLYTNIPLEQLTIFDGSDRALRDIFQVFSKHGNDVITFDPTFPMYKVYAAMFGLNYNAIPYKKPKAPIDELIAAISDNTCIVVIGNPCSPVGDAISSDNLKLLVSTCKHHNALLLIDEAYIEFSNIESMALTAITDDNVIVIRTLSKSAGSAGVRIGYAVSNKENAALLSCVGSMNEVSAFAVVWLNTLIHFKSDIISYTQCVMDRRTELVDICRNYNIELLSSNTNFMHIPLELGDEFITKKCVFPWSNTVYTRFSIPGGDSYPVLCNNIIQSHGI